MFLLMFTFFVYPAEFAIETSKEGLIPQQFIAVIMAGMDLIVFIGGLPFVHIKKYAGNATSCPFRFRLSPFMAHGRMGRHHRWLSVNRLRQRIGRAFYYLFRFSAGGKICGSYNHAYVVHGALSRAIRNAADIVCFHRAFRRRFNKSYAVHDSLLFCFVVWSLVHQN